MEHGQTGAAPGSLRRNALALYGAHFTSVALSFVAIPFLARVLRPEGWGLVVFTQSFAAVLTLVLEYGFYLSATRDIARARDDRVGVGRIVADVQSAKVLLLLLVTATFAAAYLLVPAFSESPGHLVWGWVLAVSQGFAAYWFFQGVERQAFPAIADVVARGVATLLLILLVQGPADGQLTLMIYGASALVWAVVTNLAIYRFVPAEPLDLRRGAVMLRTTFHHFVFRAASGFYSAANGFILGAMMTPRAVAYYGGAERLVRGALNVIHPTTQVVYPRVSHLVDRDGEAASRLLGLSLLVVAALALAISSVGILAAPQLVGIFLGDGYDAAVPIVRALSLLPPIVAINTVAGLQWAVPAGHERFYFRLVIVGAVANVGLALLLVPVWGELGMAYSVALAESLVAAGLIWLARRKGGSFWRSVLRNALAHLRHALRIQRANGSPSGAPKISEDAAGAAERPADVGVGLEVGRTA